MPSTAVATAGATSGRNQADVFASMANYLSRMGWDRRYIWGREVQGRGTA
jgi:membrane-bound lytic murein transglycosylase B